ncbi:MAG: peptidase [Cyanobacteria bacterium K_Offshore_surface_m2_239]|nr:peptidase [Cyanobacteria bacterium K_Offshore_surface_m2_239]
MADAPSPSRAPSPLTRVRQAHAFLAPFVLAPLLLTACTGMAYRLLKDGFGWGREQAHPLMTLHEGEWLKTLLGPYGETLYVLLNGLGLLWMLITGSALVWQRLRRGLGVRGPRGEVTG